LGIYHSRTDSSVEGVNFKLNWAAVLVMMDHFFVHYGWIEPLAYDAMCFLAKERGLMTSKDF
jgi:hypothetical protein